MKIYSYETLDSTNEFMKNNISKFEEYDVVTAENQTLGKARRGNTWVSQKGMALFTFLVKKDENSNLDDSEYLKLPLLAGFSVIKGLKKIENLDYMFKWTNDVFLYGKKITGILVEKVENNFFVGIGININKITKKDIELITGELKDVQMILLASPEKISQIKGISKFKSEHIHKALARLKNKIALDRE